MKNLFYNVFLFAFFSLQHAVADTSQRSFFSVYKVSENNIKSSEKKYIQSADQLRSRYLVYSKKIVEDRHLRDVRLGQDHNKKAVIIILLSPEGGRKFALFTKENIGEKGALVINEQVLSVVKIQSSILSGSLQINLNGQDGQMIVDKLKKIARKNKSK